MNLAQMYKVPFRQVYAVTLVDWLRACWRCHVVRRFCPGAP